MSRFYGELINSNVSNVHRCGSESFGIDGKISSRKVKITTSARFNKDTKQEEFTVLVEAGGQLVERMSIDETGRVRHV